MDQLITRPIYLKKIMPFAGKRLIKVLVGQRRVGKSCLLLQIKDILRENIPDADIVLINKELHEFDPVSDYKSLLAYLDPWIKSGRKFGLLLDEVQDIREFERALRSLNAQGNCDIYCTGSNAHLLSGELAHQLSGRYVEIAVHGLSFQEFLQFHSMDNTPEALRRFIVSGSLPFLAHLARDEAVEREYMSNLCDTILFKDVVARYRVRNIDFLRRLVMFAADNIGSLVSSKKISDYLKSQKISMAPKVVLNYLSHLSDALLISRAPRIEVTGKKIFEVNEKYFFEDIGLRNCLVPFVQKDTGKVLENVVYQHLRISGYTAYVGQGRDYEIDFVGVRGGERIYVQVAYLIPDETTHRREFGNLLRINDNHPKYVVSMDETASGTYKGIKHLNARDFLSALV